MSVIPQITYNQNETLVRRALAAGGKEKQARPYISVNHNEALVRR